MLNLKIKDYSRKGVVLFFCVWVVGIILRFTNFAHQSVNAFDVAHLYFSQHLDQIFFLDHQTPLRYLFLSFSVSKNIENVRVLISSLEFSLLLIGAHFIAETRSAKLAFFFFATWALWPVNITSLDLLAPSTMLIITLWLTRPVRHPSFWWIILCLIQLLEPLTFFLISPLILIELFRKNISANQARFLFSSSLVVICYYVAKLGVFGVSNFSFPLPSLHFLVFVLPFSYITFQKREMSSSAIGGVVIVLLAYDLIVLRPWKSYPGDDEAVAAFKTYTSELHERPVVICATIPQQDYYFKLKQNCQNEVLKHQVEKTDFYYFDLSGSRTDLVGFLKKNAPHVEEKKFHHATFLSVSY